MHDQVIALSRWVSRHRLQIAAATAFIGSAALLVLTGPVLLAVAALEWKFNHRRLLGLALLGLLAQSIVWLWQELRRTPHGRWHPCAQCGSPIEAPSRAWYCSPLCRRYARLQRDSRSFDPWLAERAAVRLRTLALASTADPELSEIPF